MTRQTLALKGLVSSVEAQKEADVNSAIVADARNLIQTIKDGRSKEKPCSYAVLCFSALWRHCFGKLKFKKLLQKP